MRERSKQIIELDLIDKATAKHERKSFYIFEKGNTGSKHLNFLGGNC